MRKIIATLFGVFVLGSAYAGTSYCPAKCDKCSIEESPDCGGNVSVGYATDYIFRGVRLASDVVTMDVNYTFSCKFPITLGVAHVSGLSSHQTGLGLINSNADGDQTDLYARVELPSFFGFTSTLGYNHYFYPNQNPSGEIAGNGNSWGDSHGAVSIRIARDICGVNVFYDRAYDFITPGNFPGRFGGEANGLENDNGAFIHTLGASKSFCLTDCVGFNLSGGVLYTDNVWTTNWAGRQAQGIGRNRSSGWNSYYIRGELPIAINCRATLIPYIAYNGSPDTWIADGVNGDRFAQTEANDILHGGVTLKVEF